MITNKRYYLKNDEIKEITGAGFYLITNRIITFIGNDIYIVLDVSNIIKTEEI